MWRFLSSNRRYIRKWPARNPDTLVVFSDDRRQQAVCMHLKVLPISEGIARGKAFFYRDIMTGDTLVVDALDGGLLIRPESATLKSFMRKSDGYRSALPKSPPADFAPGTTGDGRRIPIQANANSPHDVAGAADSGADGIGLYRLETFYLENKEMPNSEML